MIGPAAVKDRLERLADTDIKLILWAHGPWPRLF